MNSLISNSQHFIILKRIVWTAMLVCFANFSGMYAEKSGYTATEKVSRRRSLCCGSKCPQLNRRVNSPCPAMFGPDTPTECSRTEVWIASAGGAGTNLLYEWARNEGLLVGTRDTIWGESIVHALSPFGISSEARRVIQHEVKRAVFIYNWEPCDQIQSLYRQGFAALNLKKKLGNIFRRDVGFVNGSVINSSAVPHTFSQYVDIGMDSMLMEAQWTAWNNHAAGFPVMSLRFDDLWNHLGALATFLGLDQDSVTRFPSQRRRTPPDDEAVYQRCRSHDMYASLRERINRTKSVSTFDGCRIPRHFKKKISLDYPE